MIAHLLRWCAQQLAAALFRAAVDPVLKQHLPAIFQRLDRRLPLLLPAGPSAVRDLIVTAITDTTGVSSPAAVSEMLTQVERLYSPIKAAEHAPLLRDIFTAIEERT